MGNKVGGSGSKVNKDIDEKMNLSNETENKIHGLLLLGAGESGKTTLIQQMRHIYDEPMNADERLANRIQIWENTIESMQLLCLGSKDMCKTYPECTLDEKSSPLADDILNVLLGAVAAPVLFTKEMHDKIAALWKTEAIQATYKHRGKFYIMDSAEYFFTNMHRFAEKNYIPTFQDIIQMRTRTVGMTWQEFEFNQLRFRVYDIGGQRNERRKWVHQFDNVKAVIFVSSLAGYNQVVFEDNTTNRLTESLTAYEQAMSQESFLQTNVILFLNKSDLFEKMIETEPFVFPGYKEDPHDAEKVKKFIIKMFEQRTVGLSSSREIYSHIICATNTDNIKMVFQDIRHVLVKQALQKSALI